MCNRSGVEAVDPGWLTRSVASPRLVRPPCGSETGEGPEPGRPGRVSRPARPAPGAGTRRPTTCEVCYPTSTSIGLLSTTLYRTFAVTVVADVTTLTFLN